MLGHQGRPQPRGGGAARRGGVGRGEEDYLHCVSTISTLRIYNIYGIYLHKVWTSSKTGTEMITAGGDGVVRFWDIRQAHECDNRSR